MKKLLLGAMAASLLVLGLACSDSDSDDDAASTPVARDTASGTLTLYSGRAESLVGPLIAQFEKDTGINVEVRYGGSAEMAATISEEGNASPADVFWSQDPGPIGALSDKFAPIPEDLLALVEEENFKSAEGNWVGVSGRVRVIVYNPDRVQPSSLPKSIKGLTDPAWKDRVGWAPTNASFQIMVTALRKLEGDQVARQWLTAMKDNGAKVYGNNNAVLQAVAAGEVDVGIINHYYLHAAQRTTPAIKAANFYLDNSDAGSLIMVSATGILETSDNKAAAERFVEYLLSPAAQQYFVSQTAEYAVIDGMVPPAGLRALDELVGPDIDLSDLSDVPGTLQMLRETGVVQ